MAPRALTSHTLFEWYENGVPCSQIIHRLSPHFPDFEHKPGVRRTAVSYEYNSTEGLDGYWVTTNGVRISLPWKLEA